MRFRFENYKDFRNDKFVKTKYYIFHYNEMYTYTLYT